MAHKHHGKTCWKERLETMTSVVNLLNQTLRALFYLLLVTDMLFENWNDLEQVGFVVTSFI